MSFWGKYEFFKKDEFDCKCGCGLNNMDKNFVTKLEIARRYANIPFIVNSGYRCKKHNKEVGGSPTSSHMKGLAVDIKATTNEERFKILYSLMFVGLRRIGIGKTFIHVDADKDKKQNITWLY